MARLVPKSHILELTRERAEVLKEALDLYLMFVTDAPKKEILESTLVYVTNRLEGKTNADNSGNVWVCK